MSNASLRFGRLFAVAALALVVTGCGSGTSASTAIDSAGVEPTTAFTCPTSDGGAGHRVAGRLQIVTTVAPITSIVANIAGDRAVVRGIIPEGTDSHTFEPQPSVAKLLSTADIVFVNGLKLEDPTRELAARNVSPNAQIIELGTHALPAERYLYDFSFPRSAGKPNPHLWTNPPMAKCYAAIATAVLSNADPPNATYYADNYARYAAKLDDLDGLMQTATASIAPNNRALLTYHDAYAYFAAQYGWRVIGAVQVSDFEEPTPREVARLMRQIQATKVPAIFGSEVFPSPVLKQIAKETGVTYVDKLRDDDLPGAPGSPDHSFLGLLKFDFVTMVASLGGDAATLATFDATNIAPDKAEYPQ